MGNVRIPDPPWIRVHVGPFNQRHNRQHCHLTSGQRHNRQHCHLTSGQRHNRQHCHLTSDQRHNRQHCDLSARMDAISLVNLEAEVFAHASRPQRLVKPRVKHLLHACGSLARCGTACGADGV